MPPPLPVCLHPTRIQGAWVASGSSHRVATVACMYIESWDEDFQAHFTVGEHPPPVFVYDVAAALVADRNINAAWTTYQVGSDSENGTQQGATWRAWLVLDGSIAQIAPNHEISKTRVATVLREKGIVIRRQGLTTEQITEAAALYAAGHSLAQIGSRFGISHTTVAASFRTRNRVAAAAGLALGICAFALPQLRTYSFA